MPHTKPTFLFRDPLLKNQKLTNVRVATPIVLENNIDENVEGDFLLYSYIYTLDKEIFQTPPEGLGLVGEAVWAADQWTILAAKIADESRKHGWCVVVFYEQTEDELNANPRWRVFSVQQYSDWVKETIETTDDEGVVHSVIVRKGIKFVWGDDLGNAFTENVLFDDPMVHLVKYREGDGRSTFAFPDLSQAIMTLAFELRQAKGQMIFTAAKPSFLHFVYGEGADTTNTDDLDAKVQGVDATAALGISKEVLDEIRTIKNENMAIIEPALDKQIQYFAGITRLPVSFYLGEKTGSAGLSDVGVKADLLKVAQKKEAIFSVYTPYIKSIFSDVYNIEIEELSFPQDVAMDEVEEEKEGLTNSNNKDGDEEKSDA